MDKACQECWENHYERQSKYDESVYQFKLIDSLYNIATTDNAKLQKKVRRNRRMAIGGFSGLALLILLFGIK